MKQWGIIVGIAAILLACEPSKRTGGQSKVSLVPDEPDYKKDRRLEEYSKNRTNSHGATGPGSGGSFGSFSYRQSAIREQKNDTIADPMADTTNTVWDNYLEAEQGEDITTDTSDFESIW